MRIELDPLVRLFDLRADDDRDRVYRGAVGDVAVTAALTDIGMGPAKKAARRALDEEADCVVVCGVAGGVGDSVDIAELIVPETVIDRSTGRGYRPMPPAAGSPAGASAPRGSISCGDDLITDPDVLGAMASQGIVAVDMETAAVAAVCHDAGIPWTVFRSISDHAAAGLVDEALFAMTGPDGRSDPAAIARYLDEDPSRRDRLARLASDTARATEVAAAATLAFCRSLAG
jgi:adenosylhomocysteine nucleosidase